jgi:hypothetical protein
MASRRLEHHYRLLLTICILLMASFTLPDPWNLLASPGYLALGAVMLRALGGKPGPGRRLSIDLRLYRAKHLGRNRIVTEADQRDDRSERIRKPQ